MRRARLLLVLLTGCAYELPPDGSYYDDRIAPALRESCGITTSGCHLADERGRAMGNLDIGSYDALMRRQDVLVPYGPYPRPLLLLKASEPVEVAVDTLDGTVNVVTDIRHGGGVNFEQGSRTFRELVRWLDAGFSRTGAPIDRRPSAEGECLPGAGRAAGFAAEAEPSPAASYARFVSEVQPVLVERCGSGSCHGAPLADLRIACGETEEERRWNYWIAVRHLGEDPAASELLRRPLAPARGGTFHVGGDTFAETQDAGYRAILGWAEELVSAAPEHVREPAASEGYRYFVNRVQPMLVRKGCMALACHSPISVVFELRGGAGGSFSRFARERNYALARRFLALESPDPNQSRIVAKNLFPPNVRSDGDGIAHRGGSLLEDFAGRPARAEDCDGVDVDGGDLNAIPAYCVLARWHALERAAAALAPLHHLAWIERPPGIGEATDFDTYRPGADLRLAEASLGADGAVALEPSRSVLGACGLAADRADVRRPRASWDGARLAFAARASAAEPLRIYELDVASGACGPLAGVAAAMTEAGGILVHDLDPAYAPNGDVVFASTRGTSHGRPTRTPAAFQPNADLYVFTPSTGATRQLTFLLDQELAPAFMQDGRVIYTMEKREQDFHMLALRRQNLDGGDYHPLFASRGSLGFEQATDVGALPDGSFVFTAAALHATDGAGSIAVFNRSVGPDTREPDDGVLLRALTIPVRGAVERGEGAHRSPAVLPNGRVVFSCASDASATALDFDLCVVEPRRAGTTRLLSRPGVALLDAVALYGRPDRGVLVSDGAGIDHPLIEAGAPDAVVHFNDFPMIQSLMFVNDRRGRPIDPRIGGFEVLRHQPPPAGAHRPEDVADRIVSDARGRFFSEAAPIGWVPLYADGSARMRLPGGLAISYRMTDASGAELTMADGMPFAGPARQREHEQYYPGERIQRSIPRRFFNTACGSCHGSVSGRELDVTVNLDVISGASINLARDAAPTDLMRP
ncbi:MAG: hypothetical protein KF729_32515 [Sandaracinaceae bacterium]|nr:hypothetical protein [Sandaracinaceae bacterium]